MADEFNVREAGQKRARWEGVDELDIGSGFLHQATVTLDNDEIKALGDGGASAVVVEAPGDDLVIMFQTGYGRLDTTAGAYSAVPGSGWGLFTPVLGGVYVSAIVPVATMVGLTAISHFGFSPFYSGSTEMVGSGDYAGLLLNNPYTVTPVNKPLILTDWFAGGAYTLGNAANTLRLSVAYYVLNTVTGEFE